MSVFDRIGGGAARLLLRAGFLRHAVRPPSPDQLAATESDLGRRLLAGLLRDHSLSRDPAAWDLLRRVRDLLRPALAARGLVFQPVALDLPGPLALALPGEHVVVTPAWLAQRGGSLKGLVFHLAALKALAILRDSFQRCGSLSTRAIPSSPDILARLSGPPRLTETIFQADRIALELCLAAGFGPDAALDALAMSCVTSAPGPVTPSARIQRLRATLPAG